MKETIVNMLFGAMFGFVMALLLVCGREAKAQIDQGQFNIQSELDYWRQQDMKARGQAEADAFRHNPYMNVPFAPERNPC